MKHKKAAAIFSLLIVLLLNSCFGANIDITLNQNGSGLIVLDYQIAKSLDSLGKLDGNENWNTIPVGKADFERTIERLPDIKLLSFNSKENEKNIVIESKMEFLSFQGLLAFLDASGRHTNFSGDISRGRLNMTLSESGNITNPGLEKLIMDIFESYAVKISMSFPGEGSLAVRDQKGTPLQAGKDIIASGKKVSCTFPLAVILASAGGISVEFNWR